MKACAPRAGVRARGAEGRQLVLWAVVPRLFVRQREAPPDITRRLRRACSSCVQVWRKRKARAIRASAQRLVCARGAVTEARAREARVMLF